MAYVTKHPQARAAASGGPGIVANINMDMVGEDTRQDELALLLHAHARLGPVVLERAARRRARRRPRRPASSPRRARAIPGPPRRRPTPRGAITTSSSAWASRPRCSDTIPTGPTTRARTRSTRPTRPSCGAWACSRPRRRCSWPPRTTRTGSARRPSPRRSRSPTCRGERDVRPPSATRRSCLARYRGAIAALQSGSSVAPLVTHQGPAGSGPRRLVLLPFDESVFEGLSGSDLTWWTAQKRRTRRSELGRDAISSSSRR